jgi:membrane protein DedA with SNARE-associated domain
VGLAAGVTDRILSLPRWLVLVLVFAFPALEASAFVGFVFPGEIAVILGGVAASRGTVPLWAVIAAAVSGAIIGDSTGYLIGRRWGTHLLHGTVGRLPVIRTHLDKNLDSARAYVQRRKGSAVFFGRFTAALRVLVPGLAGLSEVHYPAFLAYNVAGGALWGSGFAVLGYVAGASYHRVEHISHSGQWHSRTLSCEPDGSCQRGSIRCRSPIIFGSQRSSVGSTSNTDRPDLAWGCLDPELVIRVAARSCRRPPRRLDGRLYLSRLQPGLTEWLGRAGSVVAPAPSGRLVPVGWC